MESLSGDGNMKDGLKSFESPCTVCIQSSCFEAPNHIITPFEFPPKAGHPFSSLDRRKDVLYEYDTISQTPPYRCLRREFYIATEERDMLKKMAAFFAKERS